MKNNCAIVQKYWPHYRTVFFKTLINKALEVDLEIEKITYKDQNLLYQIKFWSLLIKKNKIIVFPFSIRNINLYIALFFKIKNFFNKNHTCKLVWWGIGHMPEEKIFIKFIRSFFMRFVDVVIFYTEKEKYLYEILNPKLKKTFYFNNCIEFDKILPLSVSQKNIVGFIGTMHHRSKVYKLINIIKSINLKDKDIKFELIGDGLLYEKLRKQLNAYGNVKFYGRITDQKIINKIISRWTLGVYPGAVGLSSFSFLKQSIPYVTFSHAFYQSPEHNLLLDDLKIHSEPNEESFANIILKCVADQKFLNSKRKDMNKFLEYYSIERAAKRFLGALQEALK